MPLDQADDVSQQFGQITTADVVADRSDFGILPEESEDDIDAETMRFIQKLTSDFELGPEVAEALLNLNPVALRELLDTEETLRLKLQTLPDVQARITGISWLIEALRNDEQQSATPCAGDAEVKSAPLGART